MVIPGPGEIQGWLGWSVFWGGEAGSLLDFPPLHVLPPSGGEMPAYQISISSLAHQESWADKAHITLQDLSVELGLMGEWSLLSWATWSCFLSRLTLILTRGLM